MELSKSGVTIKRHRITVGLLLVAPDLTLIAARRHPMVERDPILAVVARRPRVERVPIPVAAVLHPSAERGQILAAALPLQMAPGPIAAQEPMAKGPNN